MGRHEVIHLKWQNKTYIKAAKHCYPHGFGSTEKKFKDEKMIALKAKLLAKFQQYSVSQRFSPR